MKTEVRCICGRGSAVEPAALKSTVKCEKCGKSIQFAATDELGANSYWILIGLRDGTPTLALPLLDQQALVLGSDDACWLTLSGEGVEPRNTELRVDVDRRVHVRHVGDDGRTWIDRAAVSEGVLEFDNELRIGENVIRLSSTATLRRIAAADAAPVVIESDDGAFGDADDDYYEEESREPRRRRGGLLEDWSTGQKVRALASIGVVAIAGFFTARSVFFPHQSDDMPSDTVFTCPVDGTTFRGSWSQGTPNCPECGQLIFGSINYDEIPVKKAEPITSAPAAIDADKNLATSPISNVEEKP